MKLFRKKTPKTNKNKLDIKPIGLQPKNGFDLINPNILRAIKQHRFEKVSLAPMKANISSTRKPLAQFANKSFSAPDKFNGADLIAKPIGIASEEFKKPLMTVETITEEEKPLEAKSKNKKVLVAVVVLTVVVFAFLTFKK